MPKLYLVPCEQVRGCIQCCFLAEQQWCNLTSRVNLIVRINAVKCHSPLLEVPNWKTSENVNISCFNCQIWWDDIYFGVSNVRYKAFFFFLSPLNRPTFQDNDLNQSHISDSEYCRHPFGLFSVSSVIIEASLSAARGAGVDVATRGSKD